MPKLAAFSTSVVVTLLLAAISYAGGSATSNKWRIEMSGQALTTGEIVFRVTPRQGEAVNVNVGIQSGRSEDDVAEDDLARGQRLSAHLDAPLVRRGRTAGVADRRQQQRHDHRGRKGSELRHGNSAHVKACGESCARSGFCGNGD